MPVRCAGSVSGGTVAERTNAPALKAGDSQGSGGSNPSRSANVNGPSAVEAVSPQR